VKSAYKREKGIRDLLFGLGGSDGLLVFLILALLVSVALVVALPHRKAVLTTAFVERDEKMRAKVTVCNINLIAFELLAVDGQLCILHGGEYIARFVQSLSR